MLMNSIFALITPMTTLSLNIIFTYIILTTSKSKSTNIFTWVVNIILSYGLFIIIIDRLGFMNSFVAYLLGGTSIFCIIFLFNEDYYKKIFVFFGIWSISSFFLSVSIIISNMFFISSPYIVPFNASLNIVFFRGLIYISIYTLFIYLFYICFIFILEYPLNRY